MNKVNYQKELEKILEKLDTEKDGPRKRLLLHACCAPCCSYVLEYLREYFDITVLYYNPNITEKDEYDKRVEELRRLVEIMSRREEGSWNIRMEEGPYVPEQFFKMAQGLEAIPEGGIRCFGCYEMRLRETARRAAEGGYDYFTTSLTISPLKNAEKLNEIGNQLEKEYGVACLHSDFKKKNGYKRSVELSEEYGLYRQDYCGCVYSMR